MTGEGSVVGLGCKWLKIKNKKMKNFLRPTRFKIIGFLILVMIFAIGHILLPWSIPSLYLFLILPEWSIRELFHPSSGFTSDEYFFYQTIFAISNWTFGAFVAYFVACIVSLKKNEQ